LCGVERDYASILSLSGAQGALELETILVLARTFNVVIAGMRQRRKMSAENPRAAQRTNFWGAKSDFKHH